MASRIPKNPAAKPPAGSQNLSHALKELESAFADWESLGTRPPPTESNAESNTGRSASTDAPAKEFRKKTQVLLDQLRQQLAELAD